MALLKLFTGETFVRLTFKINYLVCGYPHYTEQELQTEVYGPNNPPEELKLFEGFSTKLPPVQIALNAFSLLVVIKNSVLPIYTLLAINSVYLNYPHISSSFKSAITNRSSVTQSGIRFGCLYTNCTKLSKVKSFAEDLITVPVFKLCFPHLRDYYYPVLDTNVFGLSVCSIISYLFLLFGFIAPVCLYFWPLTHEVGIFVLAPKTIRRFHGEIIRRYMIDRLVSLKNEFNIMSSNSQTANEAYQLDARNDQLDLAPENNQLRKLKRDYNLLSKRMRNYIDECIPLARSEEYRLIMSRQYFLGVILCGFYFSIWSLGIMFIMHYSTLAYEEYLKLIDEYVEATGCSVWRLGENSSSIPSLKISDPPTRWTIFTAIEFLILYLSCTYLMTIDIAMSIMSLQELNLQIGEQLDRVKLVLEMTDILDDSSDELSKHNYFDFDIQLNDSTLGHLRRLHMKHMSSTLGFVGLRSFRGSKSVVNLREFAAASLIANGADLNSFLNLLIKTYISNRALMRFVKRASKNASWILMYCYVANYGGVFIVIYFNRQFNGKDYISVAFAAVAFVTTNFIISKASRVQAESKHLMELMWQLIAATWRFKDARIKHMRLLWLRQVIVLSEEGGLIVKAFNVPITYESMIEVAIWSSTLMILAFSH